MLPLVIHQCVGSARLPLVIHQSVSSTRLPLVFHQCVSSTRLPLVIHQCVSSTRLPLVFHQCVSSTRLPLVFHQCVSSIRFPAIRTRFSCLTWPNPAYCIWWFWIVSIGILYSESFILWDLLSKCNNIVQQEPTLILWDIND